MAATAPIEAELLWRTHLVRGRKVMLDSDLAKIYGVKTARLNEQFRRNQKRFPEDFAFHLSSREFEHGGRRKPPVAFTEHGAIMLGLVLNSPVAAEASVRTVRAFVYLREELGRNKQIVEKLAGLEGRVDSHDKSLKRLFDVLCGLVGGDDSATGRREIGFHVKDSAEAGI